MRYSLKQEGNQRRIDSSRDDFNTRIQIEEKQIMRYNQISEFGIIGKDIQAFKNQMKKL